MNLDQKRETNRFRFSREITLGDVLLALALGLPLIVGQVRLYDTVQDHATRLGKVEAHQIVQDNQLADVAKLTAINTAILQTMRP